MYNVLNGILTIIQASRVCAASRPRLFWTSFEISPLEGESLEKGEKTNVLHQTNSNCKASLVLGPRMGPSQRLANAVSLRHKLAAETAPPGPHNHSGPQQELRGRKDTLEGRRLGHRPDLVRGHTYGTRNKRPENARHLANRV